MNREVINKYKEEFWAWLEGAEIQYRSKRSNTWESTCVGWVGTGEYRIKLEPIIRWLVVYEDRGYSPFRGKSFVYDTEQQAIRANTPSPHTQVPSHIRIVKVEEVPK